MVEKAKGAARALAGKRDPNAPKFPRSPYIFFADEKRESVREENPDAGFGEVGKILIGRWKALSDEERAPYESKAAADKKRYYDEKDAYKNAGLPEDDDGD